MSHVNAVLKLTFRTTQKKWAKPLSYMRKNMVKISQLA